MIRRALSRLQDRVWARRWRKGHDRAVAVWMASPKRAQILACEHTNREERGSAPNGWPAAVCMDCGVGLLTPPQLRSES